MRERLRLDSVEFAPFEKESPDLCTGRARREGGGVMAEMGAQ